MKLVPMFAYQGGKTKVASKIVEHIKKVHGDNFTFIDMCCGGGSVSIEMVNQGLHPENIYMFDSGAIGAFWQQVSEGCFDIDYFEYLISKIPKDLRDIQPYLQELSKIEYEYVGEVVCEYLILQAGSFGGKQIFDNGNKFSNTSFRSYWEPTATSSRRSPVNPMMPIPSTLLSRTKAIVSEMSAIKACHTYAEYVDFNKARNDSQGEVVLYIDPPYAGTTGYKDTIDLNAIIGKAKERGFHVYVSEYMPLSKDFLLLSKTLKGGISGSRKGSMEEYLSKM